jgi:hypothetical protein
MWLVNPGGHDRERTFANCLKAATCRSQQVQTGSVEGGLHGLNQGGSTRKTTHYVEIPPFVKCLNKYF